MIDWDKYPNFSEKEFACPCCEEVKINENLVRNLQRLREELQQPIVITSAYRCPDHNEAVGGAPGSAHKDGLAVDFKRPDANSMWLVQNLCNNFNGVGLRLHGDNQYCHVDLKQRQAVWTYE